MYNRVESANKNKIANRDIIVYSIEGDLYPLEVFIR